MLPARREGHLPYILLTITAKVVAVLELSSVPALLDGTQWMRNFENPVTTLESQRYVLRLWIKVVISNITLLCRLNFIS